MTSSLAKTTQQTGLQYSPSMSEGRGIDIYNSPSVGKVQSFGNDIDKLFGSATKAAEAYYALSDDAWKRVAIDHIIQYEEQKNNILSDETLTFEQKKSAISGIVTGLQETIAERLDTEERGKQVYDDIFTNKVRVDYSKTIADLDIKENAYNLKQNKDYLSTALLYAPYISREEARLLVDNNIKQGDMSEDDLDVLLINNKIKTLKGLYETNRSDIIRPDGSINPNTVQRYLSDYVGIEDDGSMYFKSGSDAINGLLSESYNELEAKYQLDIQKEQKIIDDRFDDIMYKAMYTNDFDTINQQYNRIKSGSIDDVSESTQYKWFNAVNSLMKANSSGSKEGLKDGVSLLSEALSFSDKSLTTRIEKVESFKNNPQQLETHTNNLLASISSSNIDHVEKILLTQKVVESSRKYLETMGYIVGHKDGDPIFTDNEAAKEYLTDLYTNNFNTALATYRENPNESLKNISNSILSLGYVPSTLTAMINDGISNKDVQKITGISTVLNQIKVTNPKAYKVLQKNDEAFKLTMAIEASSSNGQVDFNKLNNVVLNLENSQSSIKGIANRLSSSRAAQNYGITTADTVANQVAYEAIAKGLSIKETEKLFERKLKASIVEHSLQSVDGDIIIEDAGGLGNKEQIDVIASYMKDKYKDNKLSEISKIHIDSSTGDMTIYSSGTPIFINSSNIKAMADSAIEYFMSKQEKEVDKGITLSEARYVKDGYSMYLKDRLNSLNQFHRELVSSDTKPTEEEVARRTRVIKNFMERILPNKPTEEDMKQRAKDIKNFMER